MSCHALLVYKARRAAATATPAPIMGLATPLSLLPLPPVEEGEELSLPVVLSPLWVLVTLAVVWAAEVSSPDLVAVERVVASVPVAVAPVPVAVLVPVAEAESVPVAVPVAEAESVPVAVPETEPVAVPETVPVAVPVAEPVAVPVAEPEAVPVTVPVAEPEPVALMEREASTELRALLGIATVSVGATEERSWAETRPAAARKTREYFILMVGGVEKKGLK